MRPPANHTEVGASAASAREVTRRRWRTSGYVRVETRTAQHDHVWLTNSSARSSHDCETFVIIRSSTPVAASKDFPAVRRDLRRVASRRVPDANVGADIRHYMAANTGSPIRTAGLWPWAISLRASARRCHVATRRFLPRPSHAEASSRTGNSTAFSQGD